MSRIRNLTTGVHRRHRGDRSIGQSWPRTEKCIQDRPLRPRLTPQSRNAKARPALAALGRQRRIRLHVRHHWPANFPRRIRERHAALHDVAMGLAHQADARKSQRQRAKADRIRHLWPQSRLHDDENGPGRALRLAPRKSASAASWADRISAS